MKATFEDDKNCMRLQMQGENLKTLMTEMSTVELMQWLSDELPKEGTVNVLVVWKP